MFKRHSKKDAPPVPQSQQAFHALHSVRSGGSASASDSPPSYDNSQESLYPSNSREQRPAMMSRGNSSNSLFQRLGSSSTTPKNKPYVPPQELQKQIDLLSANSTSPSLSAVTSNTQTDYFDVLPSFQMFQSILKRDSDQFSENLSGIPPVYGDTSNSTRTPPIHSGSHSGRNSIPLSPMLSPVVSNAMAAEAAAASVADDDGGGYVSGDEDDPDLQHNHNVSVTVDTSGHSPLDNIDKLEKSVRSPIDIQIYVTKQVPHPDVNNELETRLKEYTSDDVVNGYIIIDNPSDKPVDFGLFTVSLEGTAKITEQNTDASERMPKFKKILMKKFLKMYDLNASYGYTLVPNSAGIEYVAFTKDTHDGCLLGLPDDRVLQAKTKYKKFFTFKFPSKLLDNSCLHGILPHLFPPPSIGLDKTCFYNKGESIQLNKALGYGFLNARGTPLLTKDYSFDNVSISYTIEAKFIDKLNAKSQDPLSPHDINDPNSEAEYVIAKSCQYYLRFIPNLTQKMKYYNNSFVNSMRNGIAWQLYHNWTDLVTWSAIDKLNARIETEIDERLTKDELTVEQLKLKNLVVHDLAQADPLPSKSSPLEGAHVDDLMLGNKTPVIIYGKKKKAILSSLIKIGESKMYVRLPETVIPYASPRLLMKYNNSTEEELSLRAITSGSSNISEVYNRDESDLVSSLDISLEFTSADSATKPPQISSIDTNLVLWTYNSEYPLPFELSYDFFYSNPRDPKTQDDESQITRANLQHLKDQVFNYMHFFKGNHTQISRSGYLYLKSIKHLAVKRDIIKDYYKVATPAVSEPVSEWKGEQLEGKKVKWVKNIQLHLEAVNKNNVNLLPTFHSCLVGRIYCLQVVVKYKGGSSEHNEFGDNIVRVDVPVVVG